MTILIFFAGLIALTAGAELLVRGASKMALSFGISPLVVGLTIVAFGTSTPEVAVSVGAILDGQTDIAVGNVVGSNIFNLLFILGMSALVAPLVVHIQLIRQEVPILLGASLLLLVFSLDGRVGVVEGIILFSLLVVYTVFLVVQSRRETQEAKDEYAGEFRPSSKRGWDGRLPVQIGLIVLGLTMLVVGAGWLVSSAVVFAKTLGVSDVMIGLTIVAVGTSIPDAATSLMAAIKGERDIAVGNVVGSSTFNILGCVGISGLAAGNSGLVIPPSLMAFDIWVMVAAALACLPVFITGREIARWEGGMLLGLYVAYLSYLVLVERQSGALDWYNTAMTSFVLPMAVIALVISMVRRTADTDGSID